MVDVAKWGCLRMVNTYVLYSIAGTFRLYEMNRQFAARQWSLLLNGMKIMILIRMPKQIAGMYCCY